MHTTVAVSHISPPLAGARPGTGERGETREPKPRGSLSIAFLSRISRKKNLDYAIRALAEVEGHLRFDIYGPVEDRDYWEECLRLISGLSEWIQVTYLGAVPHEDVARVLGAHDLFLFPTKGENYGHVIREALMAGCPVVLSDQTPWRGLQELGVGWDLPLDDLPGFRSAIQACVDMDPDAFSRLSSNADAFGKAFGQEDAMVKPSRDLFNRALAMSVPES